MEDRWFGNAFQVFEATDENDLEAAIVVLRGGIQVTQHTTTWRDTSHTTYNHV